jgi:hypothetical protein
MRQSAFDTSNSRISRIALKSLVLLLPFLSTLFLLNTLGQKSFTELMPTWSDEVYYWHQAATFQAVGLDGGYYTVNEVPAPAAWAHFNAWGVFVPALHGTVAKVTGWSLYAIPLVTQLCWLVALGILVFTVAMDIRSTLLLGVVIVTFIPFLLFAPSSMLEGVQMAAAVFLAGVFARLLALPNSPRPLLQVMGLLFVLFAIASLRLTWALLCLPLLALVLRPRQWWQWLAILAVSGVFFLGITALVDRVAAPDVKFIQMLRPLLRDDLPLAIQRWLQKIGENLVLLPQGNPLEILQRAQYLLLLVAITGWGIQRFWKRRSMADQQSGDADGTGREIAFHLFNLGVILAFQLLLYDVFDWRDYRVLAPPLLLSLILLVVRRRWLLVGMVVVSMMLFLPRAFEEYRSDAWYGSYGLQAQHTTYVEWRATLSDTMQYRADAPSAWCNTVLHTFVYFQEPALLLAFQPGIGLSMILDEENLVFPLKSQYLLLDDGFYERHAEKLHTETLISVPYGHLYRNRDAPCIP